jgi:Ca2+-binding EF-hand superfamily protein
MLIRRFSFERYDTDKDKSLSFNELKYIMEKLGIPQTHLSLKEMIKRVDNDHNGKVSFREVRINQTSYFIQSIFFIVFTHISKSCIRE